MTKKIEMRSTWLVQRAKQVNRNYKSGIDNFIDLDYMGSAEFEFGTIPKTLKNMRRDLDKYVKISATLDGEVPTKICIFAREETQGEVLERVLEISKGEMSLKEWCDLSEHLKKRPMFKPRNDFWWELNNNFMFWIDKGDNFFDSLHQALWDGV